MGIEIGRIDIDPEVERKFYCRLAYLRLTCDSDGCSSTVTGIRGDNLSAFMTRAKQMGWVERNATFRVFLCPLHSGKRSS